MGWQLEKWKGFSEGAIVPEKTFGDACEAVGTTDEGIMIPASDEEAARIRYVFPSELPQEICAFLNDAGIWKALHFNSTFPANPSD